LRYRKLSAVESDDIFVNRATDLERRLLLEKIKIEKEISLCLKLKYIPSLIPTHQGS
jgi:hypothetical protein